MSERSIVDNTNDEAGMIRPQYTIAALCAGAAAVHFAMVPTHAADSIPHGVGFAVAGWAQVIVAAFLVMRPSRKALSASAIVNLLVLVGWVVSRTVGLPGGAHGWHPEAVTIVDGMTSAMEVAALIGAVALLARRTLPERRTVPVPATALAAFMVMVATTGLLASPDAREHNHGDHGTLDLAAGGHPHGDAPAGGDGHHGDGTAGHDDGHANGDGHHDDATAGHDDAGDGNHDDGHEHDDSHDHGDGHNVAADRCDLEFNVPAYYADAEIAGVDIVSGGGMQHDHGDGDGDGDGAEMTREELEHATGELDAARLVIELSDGTDEDYQEWLANLKVQRNSYAPDDTGHGGHMGPQEWRALTDSAECAALADDIDKARAVALAHPKAQDATDAGWRMVTPYVPGIAAHYMRFDYVDGEFNVEEPEMLLYDGNGPDANVIGLSYYIRHDGDEEPPYGFAGRNDRYHRHVGLCIGAGAMVIGDTTTSKEECKAMGGRKADGGNGWMSHAWVVPGCESPWGVFSAANPVLDGELALNSGKGEPCSGSGVRDRFRTDD